MRTDVNVKIDDSESVLEAPQSTSDDSFKEEFPWISVTMTLSLTCEDDLEGFLMRIPMRITAMGIQRWGISQD